MKKLQILSLLILSTLISTDCFARPSDKCQRAFEDAAFKTSIVPDKFKPQDVLGVMKDGTEGKIYSDTVTNTSMLQGWKDKLVSGKDVGQVVNALKSVQNALQVCYDDSSPKEKSKMFDPSLNATAHTPTGKTALGQGASSSPPNKPVNSPATSG